MTTQAIVSEVLNEWGLAHVWKLSGSYATRLYCVQYQESDWQLIRRLLAEEGIFFYFRGPVASAPMSEGESLVLADNGRFYATLSGGDALPFRDAAEARTTGEHVTRFERREQVVADGFIGVAGVTVMPEDDHWVGEHYGQRVGRVLGQVRVIIDGPDENWIWTVRELRYARILYPP